MVTRAMQIAVTRACLLLALVVGMVHSKDYFRAAVLEHKPRSPRFSNMSGQEVIDKNLAFFEKAAEMSSKQNVDVLLFNEYGLALNPRSREKFLMYAEEIPDPKEKVTNPCTEDSKSYTLRSMSCMARKYKMYMIINMLDVHKCEDKCEDSKENCTKCHSDGYNFYNADAAFDREGNLVGRYYKVHPFKELVNVPTWPEYQYFDTEFGRFGLVVCFDSVFKDSMVLPKDHGVDVLLYPTYWFDDILPLTSVEWQQSWALANNVHFMGANAQVPNTNSLGSGIFSKDDGALVYTYAPHGESKLLIANLKLKNATCEVPPDAVSFVINENEVLPADNETGMDFPENAYEADVGPPVKDTDYRYEKSKNDNYTKVQLTGSSGTIQSCNNDFCCDLSYASEKPIEEDYYLLSFNGLDEVKGYFTWWEETCILARCEPSKDVPCVSFPTKSKTVFKSVTLSAKFSEGVVYPAVSKSFNRLAPKSEWTYERTDKEAKICFTASNEDPLLKVALMGRIYDKDPTFVPFLVTVTAQNETNAEKWL